MDLLGQRGELEVCALDLRMGMGIEQKHEKEKERVALGEKPGDDSISGGKGRVLQVSVVNWANNPEQLVRRRQRNVMSKQILHLAGTGSLGWWEEAAWGDVRKCEGDGYKMGTNEQI